MIDNRITIIDAIINKTKNGELTWYDTKNIQETTYKNKTYTQIMDKDGHYLMAKFILRKARYAGIDQIISLIIEFINPVYIKNDTDKYAKRMTVCRVRNVTSLIVLYDKMEELFRVVRESVMDDIKQPEREYIMNTLLYSFSKEENNDR